MINVLRSCISKSAQLFVGTGISKSKTVYDLLKVVKKHIKPKFVVIDGCKIVLDEYDTYGFTLGCKFDMTEIELLKNFIKNGDIVIDVGANIGIYSYIMSKLVGTGHVYSFEPINENVKLIEQSIKLNNLTNITIVQKGVSDEPRQLDMYLAHDIAGHSFTKFDGYVGKRIVDVTTLDNELGSQNISFVKIDAEGYDFRVLEGMKNIIKNSQRLCILIEFYPTLLRQSNDSPVKLLQFLFSHGFIIKDTKTEQTIQEHQIDEITEKYKEKPNHLTNLFCIKKTSLMRDSGMVK